MSLSDVTNSDRAHRASVALSAYGRISDRDNDLKTDLTDLLADLLHLARQEGLDPEYMLTVARVNFNAEDESEDDSDEEE